MAARQETGLAMRMTINGRDQEFESPLTVAALVASLGWDPRKIAVERNLEIVPKSAHQTTLLQDGDRIEIVNFVGGG
jgi:thiamine biosynthesis protein ThiS